MSLIVFSCCWCVGGSSITVLPFLVQIIRTFATVTILVLCVLANTLQYHDTVDSHKDARTHATSGPSRVRRRLSTARLGDPISVATVMGFLEIRTVSNSAQLRSIRLNMCIHAPASTQNSLSSGLITDAAGRHHTSVSEKKLPLSFASSFNTRVSAGASLLPFSLFQRPILKFWSVRTALVRTGALNHTKRWTFDFPNICVTLCVF